jgi:EthD domain
MKLIYCLRRLPTLTLVEFQRYWLEVHGPLVRAHQEVLRIQRYVQVHTETGVLLDKVRAFRGSPEPYDGVAEIWYESRDALETLGTDPAARAASRKLLEDERRFVDSERSPIWIGEERAIA